MATNTTVHAERLQESVLGLLAAIRDIPTDPLEDVIQHFWREGFTTPPELAFIAGALESMTSTVQGVSTLASNTIAAIEQVGR